MTILHISRKDLTDEDRFHRFGLIEWWDQKRLTEARVVVIGAGALGNEIIKNLALLGVGNVLVVDKDHVENSNLSRSVLFREADNGQPKADVAARAARQIYPAMKIHAFVGDAIHALGSGVFRWADVTLCGLDNREARLHVNRQCFRVGKPWIDGAIEQLQGVARVFVPDGHPAAVGQPDQPCYECTMSERDWQLLQHRRSCAGLTRDEMAGGRTPTTPTIGSIIAGVQCQELVKLLHGLPVPAGAGLSFVGLSTDAFPTRYARKRDCPAHDALPQIVELNRGVATTTVRELLELSRDLAGADAVIELGRDVLDSLRCVPCGSSEPTTGSLGAFRVEGLPCPRCGQPRQVITRNILRLDDDALLDRTFAELGVPPFDLLAARGSAGVVGLLFADDAPRVLGELADEMIELA